MTPTCSWSFKFQVSSTRRIAKAPGYWSLAISTPRHHACRAVLSRHSRLVRAWHSHRQRPKATADASAKAGHSLYASDGYSWNFDTSTPRYQDTALLQLEGSITSLHWGQRMRTFFLEYRRLASRNPVASQLGHVTLTRASRSMAMVWSWL